MNRRLKEFLRSHETVLLSVFMLAVLLAFFFALTLGPWYFAKS